MRKSLLTFLAVIVVGLLIALIVSERGPETATDQEEQKTTEEEIQVQDTERVIEQESETTLSAFPEGFPVEAAASNSSGFKYIPANSVSQQSTVEYVSQMTLAENGKTFKDYLAAAGYEMVNKLEEADILFYYATKDNNDLSIKIDSKDNVVTVSASYLKR